MSMLKIKLFYQRKKISRKKWFFSMFEIRHFQRKNLIQVDWLIILKNGWHQKIHRLLCNNFWPLTLYEKQISEVLSQVRPAKENFIIHSRPPVHFGHRFGVLFLAIVLTMSSVAFVIPGLIGERFHNGDLDLKILSTCLNIFGVAGKGEISFITFLVKNASLSIRFVGVAFGITTIV